MFRALQHALIWAPVLQLPDFDRYFTIECDASRSGVDIVPYQGVRLIVFFSRQLAPPTPDWQHMNGSSSG
jgi:hypothetical protein